MSSEKSPLDLNINFDELETDEVEQFLQGGSRAMPEYAASCVTIIIEDDTVIVGEEVFVRSCSDLSGEMLADESDETTEDTP